MWVGERSKRESRNSSSEVYSFARTAATKNHWLGSLNYRNVSSHSSGGWKSEIKVLAGLVPSEGWKGESIRAPPLASDGLLTIFGIP